MTMEASASLIKQSIHDRRIDSLFCMQVSIDMSHRIAVVAEWLL
jgi:hypothetical protein